MAPIPLVSSSSTPPAGRRPAVSSFVSCATVKSTAVACRAEQQGRFRVSSAPRALTNDVVQHRRRNRSVVIARAATDNDNKKINDNNNAPRGPQISVFSAKPYVRDFLEPVLDSHFPSPPPRYLSARLDASTARLAAGSDVVVLFVNDTADAETLRILKDECGVGLIALRCAGFDCVDLREAARLGIRVTRVPTYSPSSVAEHSVALAMSLCRKIPAAAERARYQNFELSGLIGRQMKGMTVGVLGTGAIGTAACSIYRGLGCKVLAYDVVVNPAARAAGAKYVSSFESLLSQSDILTVHVPLNDSTRHIINEESLKKLKPGAMIVNVSRGALLDTSAVLDAIDAGIVGALAIDVYENESQLFFEDLSEIPFERRRHLVDRKL